MSVDRTLAYNDAVDAWKYYLEHDNQGRGVVLIGHSQGSGVLTQLIRNEIDGKPIEEQIVSALLLGTSLPVAKGKDMGGAFQHMPLCRSASQTGCIIAYASFRANLPPPANSRFGRVSNENTVAACVNPAAPDGGSGELHAYLSSAGRGNGSAAEPRPWVTPPQQINTPFVSVPGLLTAECVSNENGSYLAVTVHGNPEDPRTDDITGDVVTNGQVQANWGLHLIVLQPPEIRHRVLESSPGAEVIEIACPAVHETYADHDMELPTSRILPGRLYNGTYQLHEGDSCVIPSELEYGLSMSADLEMLEVRLQRCLIDSH